MFEKEAKEYSEKDLGDKYLSSVVAKDKLHAYKLGQYDGFVAGAEFGYNKCKEEINQKGLALQSDMDETIEQNIALKKELEKTEWHYVKDGDLPKDKKEVLVYMWGSFYIGYYNLQWHFECFSEESEQVTAWKEIVPPKESD